MIPAVDPRGAARPARGVLHVIHGHGGGTEHHARALIDASRDRYRHHLAIAVGARWQVEAHGPGGAVRGFEFVREEGEPWSAFVEALCASFRIDVLHLHNITGCRDGIIEALAALDLPYGYTVHDFNFACPTILFLGVDGMYCGAQTDPAFCARCLAAQPPFAGVDIVAWRDRHRALLARASFLIAPSRWTCETLAKYYPDRPIDVIPHGAPGAWAMATGDGIDDAAATTRGDRRALPLPDDGVPTVAVLGAVGPDKGARRLERLADLVRATGARVRFVLIGYMDVEHGPWQSDDSVLTVHGRYEPRELPALFADYRVRLVAYPSAGPETFSFTLSEAWAAGCPVMVPPFGALAERVAGTGAGWVWSEDEWRDEARMLARIVAAVAPEHADELAAAAACAPRMPQPTLAAMAERTLAHYDAAIAASGNGPARRTPFAWTRIRAAEERAARPAPESPR